MQGSVVADWDLDFVSVKSQLQKVGLEGSLLVYLIAPQLQPLWMVIAWSGRGMSVDW